MKLLFPQTQWFLLSSKKWFLFWIAFIFGFINNVNSATADTDNVLLESYQPEFLPIQELLYYNAKLIYVSKNKSLWFATEHGAIRYTPETSEWITFTTKDGLGENHVRSIHESEDGSLWFATHGGMSRYSPESEKWIAFTTTNESEHNIVRSIHESKDGVLRVVTSGGETSQFMPETGEWLTSTTKDELEYNIVSSIQESQNGTIWCATWGRGVRRFAPEVREWITFNTKDGLADNYVRSIQESKNGTIWCATWGGGVSRFAPESGKWITFTTEDGLADNYVWSIHESKDNSLWFATNKGASRFTPETREWTTFTTNNGLTDNDVRSIHESQNGSLWFATYGGGVSQFKPETEEWITFTTKDGLANNFIRSIHESKDGTLWFITHSGETSQYMPEAREWITYNAKNELGDNDVRSIYEFKDGSLWFATYGGGVIRFKPESGKWITFTTEDGLENNIVNLIHESKDGSIWFATGAYREEGVVSRFTPETGEWINFQEKTIFNSVIKSNQNSSIISTNKSEIHFTKNLKLHSIPNRANYNVAQALAVGPSKSIWIGTATRGVELFLSAQENIHFKTQDGLPCDGVYCLSTIPNTGNNKIWVGTCDGPALINKEIKSVSRSLSKKSGWKIPRGRVDHIATSEKFVYFAFNHIPAKIFKNPDDAKTRKKSVLIRMRHQEEPGRWIELPNANFRALIIDKHGQLWAATSAGLFTLKEKDRALQLVLVTANNKLPQFPLTCLATDDNGTIWMGTEKQGDSPAQVIGLQLEGGVIILGPDSGVPKGDRIDSLTIDDEGNLIVLVGSKFAKGKVVFHSEKPIPQTWIERHSTLLLLIVVAGFIFLAGFGVRQFLIKSRTQKAEYATLVNTSSQFFELAGLDTTSGKLTNIKLSGNNPLLKPYLPVPIKLISGKTTKTELDQLDKQARTLNDGTRLGILLYNTPPDAIARTHLALKRMEENLIVIPLSMEEAKHAIEAGPASAKTTLNNYFDRYVGSGNLFNERSAVTDAMLFFGREGLLSNVEKSLERGESIALYGFRKQGKTSVLNQLRHHLSHLKTAKLECSAFYPFDAEEAQEEILRRFGIENPEEQDFLPTLRRLAKTQEQNGGIGLLVLMLDELEPAFAEALKEAETALAWNHFFGKLRAACQEGFLALVITDIEVGIGRTNRWPHPEVNTNPVYQYFREIHLKMLSKGETDSLFIGIGQLMGLKFNPESLALLFEASGGHPFITRQLGALIANDVKEGLVPLITTEQKIQRAFSLSGTLDDYMGDLLFDLEKRGGQKAKKILEQIVHKESEGSKQYTQAVLGKGDKNSTKAVRALTEFDLVEADQDGNNPRCKVGLLAQYIRNRG